MNAVGWALLILGVGILVLFVAAGTVAFAARRTAGPDTADREAVDAPRCDCGDPWCLTCTPRRPLPPSLPTVPPSIADEAAEYLRDLAEHRRPPVIPGRALLGQVRKCAECGGAGCAWCGHARTKPRVVTPDPAPLVAEPEPLRHARFRWAPFLSTPPADGCAIYPRKTKGGEPS